MVALRVFVPELCRQMLDRGFAPFSATGHFNLRQGTRSRRAEDGYVDLHSQRLGLALRK